METIIESFPHGDEHHANDASQAAGTLALLAVFATGVAVVLIYALSAL
jgi:hypothetical protein